MAEKKPHFKEPNITINKVYTRTGDFGETGLVGGQRLSKDDMLKICAVLTEEGRVLEAWQVLYLAEII